MTKQKKDNVNMTIRIEKSLKEETEILFKDLGITTSAAINIFLKQCVMQQGFPFKIILVNKEDNLQETNTNGHTLTKERK